MTFRSAVKAVNSKWEVDEIAMSMDLKGNHYRTFYIKAGYARNPTLPECLAIANYCGMRYSKGYFLKKV